MYHRIAYLNVIILCYIFSNNPYVHFSGYNSTV